MRTFNLADFVGKSVLSSSANHAPTGRKEFIKLDLNEGYSLIDETFMEKLRGFDRFVVSSYPEYGQLEELLSQYAGVPRANLCLSNGSDHAIHLLLTLLFHAGDKVVMPAPVFSVYGRVLGFLEADVRAIHYVDTGTAFEFPLEKTLSALEDGARGLILCNPHNPLASVLEKEVLTKLIDKTGELGIPCILDEAYIEYGGTSCVELVEHNPHLIILRTFSKAFGLAGARLGYVIAGKDVLQELKKLHLQWNVNHFAVFAGETALRELPYFKSKLEEFFAAKKRFGNFLEQLGMHVYPSHTNFFICKVADPASSVFALREEGVLVNDVSSYPEGRGVLEGALRISVPSEEDMEHVKEVFSEMQNVLVKKMASSKV